MVDPKPSAVFDTYWRFAAERQATYFRRLRGEPAPWTTDPILAEHRFTNCYRVADRVSQYLIRNVIYRGDQSPREVIFRTLLFKIFNKIETWETICWYLASLGSFSIASGDLPGESSPIRKILDDMRVAGRTKHLQGSTAQSLYSAAYVMPSPGNAPVKHRAHLALLEKLLESWYPMVGPHLYGDVDKLLGVRSLQALYQQLLDVPSFGPFLAFQFAIDLNYSEIFDFDENDFVIAGPGALDGLKKCFTDAGGYSAEDLIRWTCDRQELEFARLGLSFETLFGRRLHLIDVQNLYCEISKYARVAHPDVEGVSGRTKIKQKYRMDAKPFPAPFFPPKWGLGSDLGEVSVRDHDIGQAILATCF